MNDERYHRNCEHVYNIYDIPKSQRGTTFNIHHIVMRSDVKYGLVPKNFDVNGISNLIPLKVTIHDNLHQRLNKMGEGYCQTTTKERRIKKNKKKVRENKNNHYNTKNDFTRGSITHDYYIDPLDINADIKMRRKSNENYEQQQY